MNAYIFHPKLFLSALVKFPLKIRSHGVFLKTSLVLFVLVFFKCSDFYLKYRRVVCFLCCFFYRDSAAEFSSPLTGAAEESVSV